MILILSESDDTVMWVERSLQGRGSAYARIDPADLARDGGSLVVNVAPEGFRCELKTATASLDLASVEAVWVRRPGRVEAHPIVTDAFFRAHTSETWQRVLEDVYRATDCRWLPARPCELRRADSKLHQLRVAQRLGFDIPDTLVASDANAIFDFHRKHDGLIISKMAASFPVPKPAPPFGRFTERVMRSDLAYVATSAHLGPCLFQPEIIKRLELRVTVVGERVFAVAIESQMNRRTSLDWRHYDMAHTPHSAYALPAEIEARCIAVTKALGLTYGAIDIIVTPDDRYVFLELNANGQFLWLEETTGLPIGDAICDLLINKDQT